MTATDGRSAFHAIDSAALAVLLLPAASVNLLAVTEMVVVPEPDAGGVHVAVYVAPDPVNPLSVPPVTLTSPTAKLLEDSERVKVMVMSCPPPTVPEPGRVTVTEGASESTVTVPVDAPDRFPAPSTA